MALPICVNMVYVRPISSSTSSSSSAHQEILPLTMQPTAIQGPFSFHAFLVRSPSVGISLGTSIGSAFDCMPLGSRPILETKPRSNYEPTIPSPTIRQMYKNTIPPNPRHTFAKLTLKSQVQSPGHCGRSVSGVSSSPPQTAANPAPPSSQPASLTPLFPLRHPRESSPAGSPR